MVLKELAPLSSLLDVPATVAWAMGAGVPAGYAGRALVEAFRPALAFMAVPWLVSFVGVLVSRRHTRRAMLADGVVVPRVREVLARRRGGRAAEVRSTPRGDVEP